ncbi:MAG: DUF4900 domain-containing protein [Armatimonadota bacterium]|nr:DUF4900 domain-containing protein [Armatimonadota bacterium]MDR7444636.1 DUF4900 domain-containing protein [Armatimonadota bacterium]MDR7569462.1 DUF4900 domain-containing protein [Armatimonadota bacterium]MDR7613655.1 DUF4900 domain-containing protein [Armatimonadota bacterium]
MKRKDERGVALISVLVVILILTLLGGLVLYLSGQEGGISRVRYRGTQSLAIAEGGAWAARAALMALVNANPADKATLRTSPTEMYTWFTTQSPMEFFTRLWIDGSLLGVTAGPSTSWVAFRVNWSLSSPYRKLEFLSSGSGAPPPHEALLPPPGSSTDSVPPNALGNGRYRAVVVVWSPAKAGLRVCRDREEPPSETNECPVHRDRAAPTTYLIPLEYRVVAEGYVDPQFRRRVTLEGQLRAVLGSQSFAQWLVFTHIFSLSSGSRVYFGHEESYDGPVHTNGQFWFWGFPKFGTPDASTPCDPGRIQATRLTSTSTRAGFRRISGSGPVETELEANEWVVGGQRRAAPVLPDCTPTNYGDDADNPAANFTRGFDADPTTPTIDPIVVPLNPPGRVTDRDAIAQRAVSLGLDPQDTGPNSWTDAQWNRAVRERIPELPDNASSVPDGVYLPVDDRNNNGTSDPGEPLLGGIYVQGDLRSLTISNCPPGTPGYPYCPASGTDRAYYRFEHANGQVVTVEIDRVTNRTTVTNPSWPDPQTRTFQGVPKGFQGSDIFPNATVIYVHGRIGTGSGNGLWGQVEEREQVMIAARGDVYITNHLRYERPPNIYDPTDNPTNILGLYTPRGRIRIPTGTPNDLVLQGVFMAGQPGVDDGVRSEQVVEGLCGRPAQGKLNLLGGLISEYAGVSGCADSGGRLVSGYADNYRYDRRLSRGFAPPYFPTTTLPQIQAQGLAGQKPRWQELSPP